MKPTTDKFPLGTKVTIDVQFEGFVSARSFGAPMVEVRDAAGRVMTVHTDFLERVEGALPEPLERARLGGDGRRRVQL